MINYIINVPYINVNPSVKSTSFELWMGEGQIKFVYRDTNRIPIETIIDHIIEKS